MSDSDCGSCTSDQGVGPVIEVVYPLNEETEVPGTNGQLFKTVTTNGRKENNHPPKGAKVKVHYVGTLASDGTKFDSSRDRSEPFEFTIGEGQVIKGWDKGVATMNVGEVCVLKCLPEFAYGARGSPPKIPPESTLLFEVELISWTKSEDISTNKDRSVLKSIVVAGTGYENPDYETKVKDSVLRVFLSNLGDGEEANATPNEDTMQENHEEQGTGRLLLEIMEWTAVVGDEPSYWFPGLDDAVKSMKRGERSYVTVGPRKIASEHAALNGSNNDCDVLPCDRESDFYAKVLVPAVEAAKGLRFEIFLCDFEKVKPYDYSVADRVVEGIRRKDDGNKYFMSKNWTKAEQKYRRALEFVDDEYGFGDGNEDEDQKKNIENALACTITVKSNLAQVMLSTNRPKDAIHLCNSVLEKDGNHLKTLFRRAKAYGLQDEWDQAIDDLQRLLDHDANNESALQEMAFLKGKRAAFYKKEKAKYANMFSKISSGNE